MMEIVLLESETCRAMLTDWGIYARTSSGLPSRIFGRADLTQGVSNSETMLCPLRHYRIHILSTTSLRRQLQRRFTAATGLTIKAYVRVRRLRSVLARRMSGEGDESWSMSAAEGGYADRAHLSREFAQHTGLGPRDVMRHLARIKHRNVNPRSGW